MPTIEELLRIGPRPTLKVCDKCGLDFFLFHDCKRALEKPQSPVDKLKEKFKGQNEQTKNQKQEKTKRQR